MKQYKVNEIINGLQQILDNKIDFSKHDTETEYLKTIVKLAIQLIKSFNENKL